MAAVELKADERARFLDSLPGQQIEVELPADVCWYRNQEVTFAVAEKDGFWRTWGVGQINVLTPAPDGGPVLSQIRIISINPTHSLLAPHCGSWCDEVTDLLPDANGGRLIDLRSSTSGAAIDFLEMLRFTGGLSQITSTSFGADRQTPLTFFTNSPETPHAIEALRIMKRAKEMGYTRVRWFYPGFDGWRGRRFPEPIPGDVPLVSPKEAREILKKGALIVYVPPDRQQTSAPASLNAAGAPIVSLPFHKVDYGTKVFSFNRLPSNKERPLLFVSTDGARSHVFDAAIEALQLGHVNTHVLPGGAYELEKR